MIAIIFKVVWLHLKTLSIIYDLDFLSIIPYVTGGTRQ